MKCKLLNVWLKTFTGQIIKDLEVIINILLHLRNQGLKQKEKMTTNNNKLLSEQFM